MTNPPPSDPPDMDLIRRVQAARMLHDADAVPSQISAVYWIEAKRQGAGPAPTSRAGQWIIPVSLDEVDAAWVAVKQATESGALGYKARVSTASRDGQPNSRVIAVATYDADDLPDVERVRAALRNLGLPALVRYERQTE